MALEYARGLETELPWWRRVSWRVVGRVVLGMVVVAGMWMGGRRLARYVREPMWIGPYTPRVEVRPTERVMVREFVDGNLRTGVVLVGEVRCPSSKMTSDYFLEDAQSKIRYVSGHWPEGGVWVDGVRVNQRSGMVVLYTTDERKAVEVEVKEGEQGAFLTDLRQMKPFAFVEKWIQPRLK